MPSPPHGSTRINAPNSVSRDKSTRSEFYRWEVAELASVLGKRTRGPGEEKAKQEKASRRPSYTLDEEGVNSGRYSSPKSPDSSDSESLGSSPESDNPRTQKEKRAKPDQESDRFTVLIRLENQIRPYPQLRLELSEKVPLISHISTISTPPRSAQSLPTISTDYVGVEDTRTHDDQEPRNETREQQETYKQGFPVVYRILCSDNTHRSRQHSTYFSEDDPLTAAAMQGRRSSHLSANKPIYHLQDHVQQFQQPSFVIIKNRNCESGLQYSSEPESRSERMLISDNTLRLAIQKVATCPVDNSYDFEHHSWGKESTMLEMRAPYPFIYLYREPLMQYANSVPISLSSMIKDVLKYVVTSYAAEYAEAGRLMSQGKITFRHLDKLFRPNELIAERPDLDENHDVSPPMYVQKTWPSLVGRFLSSTIWKWTNLGSGSYRHQLSTFIHSPVDDEDEPFNIERLDFYPMRFASEERVELTRKRGKIFWTMLQPTFVYCHNENYAKGDASVNSGRYMIDIEMYERLHDVGISIQPAGNKQTDTWRERLMFGRDEPTEDEFLLMPSEIPGYDFLEKAWVKLPVSNIKPVIWNKQPFEDLVLPEDTKHLVKAMVTIRASSIKSKREKSSSPHAAFDIIPGKGNGLVMLFHGSPGTGKTLTAESVAEIAEMPLYPITCGDIGMEPEKVEKYLQLVFMLGKRWNCVLLLDEADVFLEERSMTDLQRNSLVSVFLRMIEYYEGILILTSNRVGTFDEAFRSRINIALHYEDLNARSRKEIWNNFLARLELTDEGENVEKIRDRVDGLARHKLNGREIRNALSTARQLASYGGTKMDWEHLQLAIETANDFGSYLKDVHGHSDREWAREARTR